MERTPLFRIDTLAATSELGVSSGKEIRDRLTEPPYNRAHPRDERVYANLNRLAEDGLIEKGDGQTPQQNSYQITPEGREYLRERIRMLERALTNDNEQ